MTYIMHCLKELWKEDPKILIAILPMGLTLFLGFPLIIVGAIKIFSKLLIISSLWLPSMLLLYINKEKHK